MARLHPLKDQDVIHHTSNATLTIANSFRTNAEHYETSRSTVIKRVITFQPPVSDSIIELAKETNRLQSVVL